jgi:hypothetical protein
MDATRGKTMKRFLLSISALAMIAGSAFADDCNCEKCRASRQNACRPGLFASLFGGPGVGGINSRRAFVSSEYMGPPMQQLPAVAYPYYTTRGPRDFLAKEPYGIGP